jgi:hypothetical protein
MWEAGACPGPGRTVRLDRNVRDGELLVHAPAMIHLSEEPAEAHGVRIQQPQLVDVAA